MGMFWAKLGNVFRRDEFQTLSAVLTNFFALHPEIKVKSVLGLTFSFFRKINGTAFEESRLKNDLLILSERFLEQNNQYRNSYHEIQLLQWEQEDLWQYFQSFPAETRMDLLDFLGALHPLNDAVREYDDAEATLHSAAEKLHLQESFALWLENRKLRLNKSGYSAKSAAGLIVALVVLLIFILMVAYLKVVFFGFLFAYLFLPLAKWYRKNLFETRIFQRISIFYSRLFLPLNRLKKTLWKQVGFTVRQSTLAEKAAAKRESLANHAAGVTICTFIVGICLLLTMVLCIFVPYIMNAGKQLNQWAQEKNFVNR